MPLPRRVIVGLASVALQLTVAVCVANADTLEFSFSDDAITATPGETVTFQGTLTNDTDAPLYITSAGYTFPSVPPDPGFSEVNCSFNNTCPDDTWLYSVSSMDPAETSGVVDLFTVTVPDDLIPADYGTYSGGFSIYGGASPDDGDTLVDSVPFYLTVEAPASSTPEPSTKWLLLPALACVPYLRRRGFRTQR